jgi:hypothetical protein
VMERESMRIIPLHSPFHRDIMNLEKVRFDDCAPRR